MNLFYTQKIICICIKMPQGGGANFLLIEGAG